jgi:triosephosphate isomerase (TIM)
MRPYYIAGNWKMHKTAGESVALAVELVEALRDSRHKIMIAPAFTALQAVSHVLEGSRILLGAQNMASVEQGAHTGEVSVLMLKDLGARVVIIGHSERRTIYGETDELVNTKVRLALSHGLEVILCVGETLDEREAGKVDSVVTFQVDKGLASVPAREMPLVTIAYEPVWAIGTGRTATPADADAVHRVIRAAVSRLYGQPTAQNVQIQYGGSVKPENVTELMAMENIDGALVGGASLKADSFAAIAGFAASRT